MQIVVSQLDLLAEDMGEKVVDVRKDALGRLERNRLVTVQEAVDLPAVVRVVGNRAEAVVFRNTSPRPAVCIRHAPLRRSPSAPASAAT